MTEAILTMAAVQAPSRVPDQPCADCLGHSPAAGLRSAAVPRRAAFWLLAFVFGATMLGTTLPTPVLAAAGLCFSQVPETVNPRR